MNDKVVIAGTVKLRNTIKAKTNLHNTINGTPSWVVNTGGGGIVYPHYTGSYTVTPSGSVQTLDTSDKVLDDDVTIQAMPQGSATTPATIITADPTISVSGGGLITATVSKTQQITPTVQEGYVETGTPGNVGVSGSNTQQLTVQSAQTIHPSSSDQEIASGKYLTGKQTIKKVVVSGLSADKIVQGTTVKIGDVDDDDRIASVVGTAQQGITPTGTKQITANGTGIDVYNYQYADVAVPNSYSAGDEGKVVSNGALVAQTSDSVTQNGTVDTTLIDELTVNVPTGGGGFSADEIAMSAISGDIVLTSTEIKAYAFFNCQDITSLYSNTVTTVGEQALNNIDADIILPSATAYGENAFYGSNGDIILPNLKTIVNGCRHNGDAGKILCFSRAEGSLPTDCFRTNYHTILDIGYISVIGLRGIYQGTNKAVLILRYTGGVVDASATSAIGAVPNSCKVYVPSALLSSYQQSTQWSSKDLQVLEGSIYEDEDWAL